MILITSAAYVNNEFQIEFGRLPPAFLPVGNKRLFERQIDVLKKCFPMEEIFLSIPDSFSISLLDQALLNRLGVVLLKNEDDLSLASSIGRALELSGKLDGSLRILHGDTLFLDFPDHYDLIGVSRTNSAYAWEVELVELDFELVWSGFFSFSDAHFLRECLRRSGGDFSVAIRLYEQKILMDRVEVAEWFDFGHINTYFNSRSKITTERKFNSLIIKDGCVKKTSKFFKKIDAEGEWFLSLPVRLRPFCPQMIDRGIGGSGEHSFYLLEYLPLPPLNEVYVYGRNPHFFWENIFSLMKDYFDLCLFDSVGELRSEEIRGDFYNLIDVKTWGRLADFIAESDYPGIDIPNRINGVLTPSIREIVNECINNIKDKKDYPGILHGDLCLSNILFDSRLGKIKLIDPRGLNASGCFSLYGDLKYDLAKLTHSVIGLYDHILAGAYSLNKNYQSGLCEFELSIYTDSSTVDIQNSFIHSEFLPGLRPIDVVPVTILLFFAMLPLHSDDNLRRDALLANGLRLYSLFLS